MAEEKENDYSKQTTQMRISQEALDLLFKERIREDKNYSGTIVRIFKELKELRYKTQSQDLADQVEKK